MSADAAETVAGLKRQEGKDMVVWGSLTLARLLMKARMVDHYELVVCAVVPGDGTSLLDASVQGFTPSLQETTSFDRGAVALTYVP